MITNTSRDRTRIRQGLEGNVLLNPGITPVLLLYWNQDGLETYLIPCDQQELEMLKSVNGVLCNEVGWKEYEQVFDYIEQKRYDSENDCVGEWKNRFLVDTHDSLTKERLPVPVLPRGTLVIQTGMIL